jgi:hypothetical protein
LQQEAAELRKELENEQQQHREQLEIEKSIQKDLRAKLAAATKRASDLERELNDLRLKYDASEQQVAQGIQRTKMLQEELARQVEACALAGQRQKTYEDQLAVQDALKTSRLGFVTEVWSLHKAITEINLIMPMTLKSKPCTSTPDKRSPRLNKVASPELDNLIQSMGHACRQSKNLIAKYFTDDEKLHLGAPLALYEGGHDSPQPLDWSVASESTRPTSPSGNRSSAPNSTSGKVVSQHDTPVAELLNRAGLDATKRPVGNGGGVDMAKHYETQMKQRVEINPHETSRPQLGKNGPDASRQQPQEKLRVSTVSVDATVSKRQVPQSRGARVNSPSSSSRR